LYSGYDFTKRNIDVAPILLLFIEYSIMLLCPTTGQYKAAE